MDVTDKNFDEVIDKFPRLLENAQFIAIDTEFTGLKVDGGGTFNYFDTLNEFYSINRQRTCTFLAVQYGICLFEYNSKTDSYTHHAFNFYVYPKSSKRNYSCQVSCMRFLCEHGFDFNKLFRDGIPFLTRDEVNAKLENFKARKEKLVAESPAIKVPKDQKKLIEGIMKTIKDFMDSEKSETVLPSRYNSFIRRIIYQTSKEKFGSKLLIETTKDETLRLIKGLTDEEKEKRQNEKWQTEQDAINREFGFSRIIEMIINSGKLIIGHNILIDLLFTVHQFLQPLPADFEEFREMVHELFPKIVDTKHLATASHVKDAVESSLAEVLNEFDPQEIPHVEIAETGMGYIGRDTGQAHEAAFDAYVTGLSFLALMGRTGKLNMTNIYKILPDSTLLKPFLNKLSIPRMHDINYMDLEKTNRRPDRQNVFHIRFPQEWKQQDILNHFDMLTGFVNIRWIDATSAFMGVTPDSSKMLKRLITSKTSGPCTITTYDLFRGFQSPKRKLSSNDDDEDIGEIVIPVKKKFQVPSFDDVE